MSRQVRLTGFRVARVVGAALMLSVFVAQPALASGPTIVANNAAFGNGPVQSFDFSTGGNPVGSFVPAGATPNGNGRGLEVIGSEVFYTELTNLFGPTDVIHVAPYNGGAGGADIRTLPNPDPGLGVQDLSASGGSLYAMTGYLGASLKVFKLDPSSGAVLAGPITIAGPESSADGFAVLPNGNFLINDGDADCAYNQYDGQTGALVAGTRITVPGAGQCTGVDTDGRSLYFATNFSGFQQTDMAGNPVASAMVHGAGAFEDISLIQAAAATAVDTAPGKPAAPTVDQSQNADGHHTVSWTAVTDGDGDAVDHYVLQHERSDQTSYTDVANVSGTSYHFGMDGASEGEGTWTYRVIAVDSNATSSDASPASSAVVVDQTKPNSPTLAADTTALQAPSYTSGGGVTWYRDSELVDVSGNGDPANAADASPGTGVDSTSFPASFSVATNGTGTASKTVKDNVGNQSTAGTLSVNVDAQAPTVSFTDCPTAAVPAGTAVTAHWQAADGESGLATASSGGIALATTSIGSHSVTTPTTTDNVGHSASSSTCRYTVAYGFDGFYKGVSNGAWNKVQAGSAVPLKFSLDGPPVANQNDGFGTNVFAASPVQPVITKVTCPSNLTTSDATTATASGSKLLYDGVADQYNYVWKTPSTYKGCYTLQMTFNDSVGTQSKQLRFYFK